MSFQFCPSKCLQAYLQLPLYAAISVALQSAVLAEDTQTKAQAVAPPEAPKDARIEDAEHFIEQAKQFKLNAAEYHATVIAQSKDASELSVQAKKLSNSSRKLNARIQTNAESDPLFKLNTRQFNLHTSEFQEHAKLYNGHLADYEKDVLKAQATAGQLRSSCQHYADHVQKYHIPSLRPPHVCVQLQWENKDMQRVARGFKEDQLKSQQAEAALSKQESELAQAAHERATLEAKLLQKSNLDELERTQGAMLLKEYEQIEREYRMLQQEKKRIESKQ